MKVFITLLATVFFLFSCNSKNETTHGILKKEKFEVVLWDVIRADAFTFQFITKDSSKKPEAEMVKLQQQVFATHKTSREEFNKSFEYYKAKPDVLQPMLDSMINKYTREKNASTYSTRQHNTDTLKAQ